MCIRDSTKGVPVPSENVIVQEVAANSPASIAGLEKGDMIIGFFTQADGKQYPVKTTAEVSKVVKQFGGKDIGMTITRDGNDIEASITPRKDPPKGQGALGVVISNYTIKKYSYTEAPVYLSLIHISSNTIDQLIKGLILQLGENISIGEFTRFEV